ncbi:DUF1778 domain-containing protein [Acinetobacter tjernbergiae]|uniref:DUF1778 domain-containing protein n=1 Tax=Acinetobacter tjernbergiae DSM 14971 = CIP 107465 TaxID=1120928 RepID=V2UP77_9GAMM|nr:DUF1778 domain-containing protein [Acinetobacter tjernbergiae]ESK56538.1 hypothetical protein F990_00871 [Acinetobacter tjernbergiae DSM 14971 = CIP 107465]
MSAYHPRITARVDEQTQALLLQAANLLGMPSLNAFVLSAAIEKAKQVLIQEQSLQLNEKDVLALITALDQPIQVHSKLKQAAQHYRQTQE